MFCPSIRVVTAANEYHRAAELCFNDNLKWVGAINAALAIEIYLKALVAKDKQQVISDDNELLIAQGVNEVRGHSYLQILNKISAPVLEYIEQRYKFHSNDRALRDDLDIFNGYFMKARYFYESNSAGSIDPQILSCSGALKKCLNELL